MQSRGQSVEQLVRFPKERVSEGDTFRCRKCRIYLFSFDNLTSFHKKIEPVEQCSAWYLNCDDDIDVSDFIIWVKEAINKSQWTEGKIYCPKCTSRIGAFNFTQGVKCSCFAFVIPAIWIQKCKVDQVVADDMKVAISFPRKHNNPDGKNGDTVTDYNNSGVHSSQASQTGSQTSQTGSQTSQTGSQTSQTGSQTSQTGLQTSQTRSQTGSQTSQAGSQTSQIVSQDFLPQCKTCSFSSLTKLSGPQLRNFLPGVSSSHQSQINFNSSPPGLQIAAYSQATASQTDSSCSCLCLSHPQTVQASSQPFHCDDEPVLEMIDIAQSCGYSGERCTHEYQAQRFHSSTVYKRHKNKVTKTNQSEEIVSHAKDLHRMRNTQYGPVSDEDNQEETDDIPEHLICPVCLDLLYEPLFCPCNHVFCDSCLRLLNSKCKSIPKCPLCRKSLRYVYPAVDLREEIRKTYANQYRKRHRVEKRAVHRRLPLPNSRLKPRRKKPDNIRDVAMPYSVLVFLLCILAVSVLCLIILFVFCPPASNRCITVIGYDY